MRHLLALAALVVLASPVPAAAQYLGLYAFTGVSGPDAPMWQAGAGIERAFRNGVAISVDGGMATNGDDLQKLGHVSVNGLYHFKTGNRQFDPFVLGGVGILAVGYYGGGAFAVGGGLNYWMNPRIGVRLEFKDSFLRTVSHGLFHMAGFRVGITVR